MIETKPTDSRLAKVFSSHLYLDVLLPFLGSRILLILFGYLSTIFPTYYNYPGQHIIERGWQFTPYRFIDFWGRWDTGWYFNIIENGYVLRGDPTAVTSNIAYYPLYPYLVKGLGFLVPGIETQVTYLGIGLMVSNIAAIIALILLYRLVIFYLKDRFIARHTVWLLLVFPSGFILSCFYTESVFLCLAVAAFWFGSQKKWALACLCIALAGSCRAVGIALAVPILYLYLEQRHWNFRKLDLNLLWFLITPIPYLWFLYKIQQTTGNFLFTFQVQQAWGRSFAWPWETLISPNGWNIYHTPMQQLLTVVMLYGIYLAYKRLPARSLALLGLILLLPPLFTGILASTPRYYLVLFPVFMAYASWINKKWILYSLLGTSLLLQLVYFMGWCRFYWIF